MDDVTFVLQRLSNRGYESIYDDKFFREVRFLHRFLGLKITLYVYSRFGNLSLDYIPDLYAKDFSEASTWLKLGFHAVSEEQGRNNILPGFAEAFEKTQLNIVRFASEKSVARVLRLHYWFYPEEYIDILEKNGISTVLTKEGQSVQSISIKSWETQVCVEKQRLFQILRKVMSRKTEQPFVAFTHEWALNRRNKIKLFLVIVLLKMFGYNFLSE